MGNCYKYSHQPLQARSVYNNKIEHR